MILTYIRNEEDGSSTTENLPNNLSEISSIQKDHSAFSTPEGNFYFEVVYPEMFSQKNKASCNDIFFEKLEENKQNDNKLKNIVSNISVDIETSSFLNSMENQIEEELNNKNKISRGPNNNNQYIITNKIEKEFSFEEENKYINLNNSLDINKSLMDTQRSKNFIPKELIFSNSPANNKNTETPTEKIDGVYPSNFLNYYDFGKSIKTSLGDQQETNRIIKNSPEINDRDNCMFNKENVTKINSSFSPKNSNYKCTMINKKEKLENEQSSTTYIHSEITKSNSYLENKNLGSNFHVSNQHSSDSSANNEKYNAIIFYKNYLNNQLCNHTITQDLFIPKISKENQNLLDVDDKMTKNNQVYQNVINTRQPHNTQTILNNPPSNDYRNNFLYSNSYEDGYNEKYYNTNLYNPHSFPPMSVPTLYSPYYSNVHQSNYNQNYIKSCYPTPNPVSKESHQRNFTNPQTQPDFNLAAVYELNYDLHQHHQNQNFNQANNLTIFDDEKLANASIFLARDQTGCRLIQKRIENNPSWGTDKIFPIIFNSNMFLELILDPFGNYLIQKLIDYLKTDDIEKIIKFTAQFFYEIGIDIHGTRVIQKLIEKIDTQNLFEIFKTAFHPYISDLIKDANGNHIIIKFSQTLYKFDFDLQFLYSCIEENLIDFATNKHSCSALQKCIDTATKEQKEKIIDKIIETTYILMSDQFGNYILQYVIIMDNLDVNDKISIYFKNKVSYLAKQKYTSNVIEKLFDHCSDQTRLNLIKEICNPKIIGELLLDNYGNYVLQKAIMFATEPHKTIFLKSITPYLEKLQSTQFGAKLKAKLLAIYPELQFYQMGESKFIKGSVLPLNSLKTTNNFPNLPFNNFHHNNNDNLYSSNYPSIYNYNNHYNNIYINHHDMSSTYYGNHLIYENRANYNIPLDRNNFENDKFDFYKNNSKNYVNTINKNKKFQKKDKP